MAVKIVSGALTETVLAAMEYFCTVVVCKGWVGRENEAVNAFVFGCLLDRCRLAGFTDPTHFAIETAVPQNPSQMKKKSGGKGKLVVRKDVVIWPRPWMTVWNGSRNEPTNYPIAIMEWKVDQPDSVHDLLWLQEHAHVTPELSFLGFRVNLSQVARVLKVDLIQKDKTHMEWFLSRF